MKDINNPESPETPAVMDGLTAPKIIISDRIARSYLLETGLPFICINTIVMSSQPTRPPKKARRVKQGNLLTLAESPADMFFFCTTMTWPS